MTVDHVSEGRVELGVGCLVASWPSEGQGRLEEFVEGVLPTLVGSN